MRRQVSARTEKVRDIYSYMAEMPHRNLVSTRPHWTVISVLVDWVQLIESGQKLRLPAFKFDAYAPLVWPRSR